MDFGTTSISPLPNVLEGAIDLHLHSAPDLDARKYDDLELAQEAKRAGMAAVLIKSHQNSTVERAWLVSRVVTGIQIFGGLVLNSTVGGLNPDAVQLALSMGAKEIWMPTRSARNHRAYFGQTGGLTVLDGQGELSPEAVAIVDAVAASNCILGTGHLCLQESLVLIAHARRRGVRKILVTHPEWAPTLYPLEVQKELAESPGVWFERCFFSTTEGGGRVPCEAIHQAIIETGVAHNILSTDLGQPETPPPAEGLRLFAEWLGALGVSREELLQMMQTNPAHLLFG